MFLCARWLLSFSGRLGFFFFLKEWVVKAAHGGRNQRVKRANEWDSPTKSELIDRCSEKAISALYVELSGYHGSAAKGHFWTETLCAVDVVLTSPFSRQKKNIFLNWIEYHAAVRIETS